MDLVLACGPYLDPAGLWTTLVVFLLLKPAAYYAFARAFRYRVRRTLPLTQRQCVRVALARAGLGILLVVPGAAVVVLSHSDLLLAWSWLYLYVCRAAAWFIVGRWGAVVRGRRLAGWVISGTIVNAAFDVAVVAGLLEGWAPPLVVVAGIAAFIALLHVVGRRPSLRSRFAGHRACPRCAYDLHGNASGHCPECGAPVREAA